MEKNEKLSNWVENAHTQVGGERERASERERERGLCV